MIAWYSRDRSIQQMDQLVAGQAAVAKHRSRPHSRGSDSHDVSLRFVEAPPRGRGGNGPRPSRTRDGSITRKVAAPRTPRAVAARLTDSTAKLVPTKATRYCYCKERSIAVLNSVREGGFTLMSSVLPEYQQYYFRSAACCVLWNRKRAVRILARRACFTKELESCVKVVVPGARRCLALFLLL
jgi:hypothetical protein